MLHPRGRLGDNVMEVVRRGIFGVDDTERE